MVRSRLRVWIAAGSWLLLAAQPGCRRATGCPPGTKPLAGRGTDGAVWCQGADATRTFWVELYPGTRQARQACPFTAKSLEGRYESFHAQGQPWVSGTYAHGRRSGRWVQLDAEGHRVGTGEYRDGQLVQGAPVGVSATCDRVAAP
jgi:hypothetical protein